jgi:predicted alpha/beta-hydrolase family hydrolase
MPVEPEQLVVSVNDRDSVTALLYAATKKNRAGITVLLGHGAGANQTSSFMTLFASGLASRGFDAMTFNFIYAEQGRGGPDPKPKLESCYRSVIDAALKHKKLNGNRLVIGGKSMGGRIASQVAAGEENDSPLTDGRASARLAGLVFLGYPLHPPGKPEKMRDAHLKSIRAPMLFIQGSRDAFGTPAELRAVIKRDRLHASLQVIDGGDHSFKVPKSSPIPQQQIYETTMDQIAHWSQVNTK